MGGIHIGHGSHALLPCISHLDIIEICLHMIQRKKETEGRMKKKEEKGGKCKKGIFLSHSKIETKNMVVRTSSLEPRFTERQTI